MATSKIRVLLVDDHAILREGLRSFLSLQPDIEVVGEAGDGLTALEQARLLQPDVVLMDITMPAMDGLEATRRLREESPNSRVLILTQHDDREYVFPLLEAGAAGYVPKKAGGAELLAAIRGVYEEGAFLSPSIARLVVERYVQRPSEGEERPHLTERETEVLRLLAEGKTNKEIAAILCLSVKTVMVHRANIMEKLGLHSRTELVKYAIRQGLVQI